MKRFRHLLSAAMLLAATTVFSQITNNLQLPTSVNTDGSAPDSSAIFDVQSTDKGLLLPRMTTAQRDAIANPEPGLIIYNTTDSCFNYFVGGSTWVKDCGRSLNADSNMPLVIKGGGTGLDEGKGVATDASGNVIVTGWFQGTATFGSVTLTSAGSWDVFIVKYDASGNVLWARQDGGTGQEEPGGVATDASGNVFVTGYFLGTATFGSETLTSDGGWDVFTVKYDPSGNLLWARQGGGTNFDLGYGVATDASGNVFVTGRFEGTATFGSETLTCVGFYDVFTVKYDASGNVLWARQGGGTSQDQVRGVATDASGNVFVTGYFLNTATFGSETLTSDGGWDVFTVKYDVSGNVLWARKGGGTEDGLGYGVATDASGNVFITGGFESTATFGSETVTSAGGLDVFTVKYDASGNVLWAKQDGGSSPDFTYGVATDASGNVFVTGRFEGMATFGSETLTSAGSLEVFTLKYDALGNVVWARQGGGTQNDEGNSVATDASGNVFVTGYFRGTATFGSETLTSAGAFDMFLVGYSASGGQSIPTNNLSAYQDNDADPTNELQNWNNLPGIPAAFADGTDDVNDADADPTNELQNWSNLPGIPAAFADGTDDVNDADADPTNELQNWSNLPGIPAAFSDGTDDVDDADADPTNELQNWSNLPGIPAAFADGTDDVNDADADPANELNTSFILNGTNLEITDAGGTIAVDLSSLNIAETDPEVGANTINFLPKWNGSALAASTSVFEDAGGKVGIGIMAPVASMDVRGINGVDNALNVASDAGDQRFRVRNDGRSGFNNTYTNVTLNVRSIAGDVFAFNVEDNAGTQRFIVSDDGHAGVNQMYANVGLNVKGVSGDAYAFNVQDAANTHRFTVRNDGKTGIGTLNPSTSLQVNALTAGDNDPVIKVLKENCGQPCGQAEPTQGIHLQNTNAAEGNTIGIGFADLGQDLAPSAWIGARLVDKTQHRAILDFRTKGADTLNTRMVIDTAGKVGIGTDIPGALLHLQGGALLAQGTTGETPASGSGTRLMWIPAKKAFRTGEVDGSQWDDANIGFNSFVGGGLSNKATETGSFAGGGDYNTASGLSSFTGGGESNDAIGDYSFTGGGSQNSASGNESFAGGGNSNTASGISSFAGGGSQNVASGTESFAGGGNENTASGSASFTGGGINNIASGGTAFAGGGYQNTASGGNSFAGAGQGLRARSYGEAVFGTWNTDYTPVSTGAFNTADRLFVVGNGTSSANRSNALTIFKNGKIAIGHDNPEQQLDVRGPNTDNSALMILGNSDLSHRLLFFGGRENDPEPFIQWKATDPLRFATDAGGFSEKMRIAANGNVGIGRTPLTNILEVEGDASKSSAGNWLANSDARLKKNIAPLNSQEMLQKLLALQGVTYEWNDEKTGSKRPQGIQYGFTAQNIQQVFPTLVEEDNLGYLQTAYGTYDAMTVEAIRALKNENDQLRAEMKSQQSIIEQLQSRVNEIDQLKSELTAIRQAIGQAGIVLK